MFQTLYSVLSNCSLRLKMGIPYNLIISLLRVNPRETLAHMYKNFYYYYIIAKH